MSRFPLQNKRIIITGPSGSLKLHNLLVARKADVTNFPMTDISPADINPAERQAFKRLNDFYAIFFTSKNGVKFFFNYLKKNRLLLKSTMRFYLIGKPTAKYLEKFGRKADFINPGNTAGEFIPYLLKRNELKGKALLLVLGNLAPDTLYNALSEIALPERINIYETRPIRSLDITIFKKIIRNQYDLIIFTSPSAIDNLLKMSPENINPENMKAACIGKRTEKALNENGYESLLTASKAKMEVLVNETEEYFLHHS
jgi:uroporphyrinogen-III synthase